MAMMNTSDNDVWVCDSVSLLKLSHKVKYLVALMKVWKIVAVYGEDEVLLIGSLKHDIGSQIDTRFPFASGSLPCRLYVCGN